MCANHAGFGIELAAAFLTEIPLILSIAAVFVHCSDWRRGQQRHRASEPDGAGSRSLVRSTSNENISGDAIISDGGNVHGIRLCGNKRGWGDGDSL